MGVPLVQVGHPKKSTFCNKRVAPATSEEKKGKDFAGADKKHRPNVRPSGFKGVEKLISTRISIRAAQHKKKDGTGFPRRPMTSAE